MSFSDTNYIIMGGTTGLGLSAAEALIGEGARVVLVGRNAENGKRAAEKLGPNALALAGDATAPETIDQALQLATETFGPVSGLFHVAGGSGRKWGDGPIHEITAEGWNKTMELNLTSIMWSNRAMINYFRNENLAGSILNMGSVLGFFR